MKLDIEEVLDLLANTELTGIEIAAKLGVTPSAITHIVKTKRGMSPTEYRVSLGWFIGARQYGYPPSKVEAILALYDQGLSVKKVSLAMKAADSTILRLLRERGCQIRPTEDYLRIPLPESEVARRYKAGETTVELADSYSVCEKTIRRVLDRQSVPRRPMGRRPKLTTV